MACSPESFIEQAKYYLKQTGHHQIVLLGDGTAPYLDAFQEALGESMTLASPHQLLPKASALADLARLHLLKNPNDFLDTASAKPVYLRLSEAEYRLGKGEL